MKTAVSAAIRGLLDYAEERGLIERGDRTYCFNRLLEMLKLDAPDGEGETLSAEERENLQVLRNTARGLSSQFGYMTDLMDAGIFTFEEIKKELISAGEAADTVRSR